MRMARLRVILALCVVSQLSFAASPPFTQHCNASLHFDCHDSSKPCIPLGWKCDGISDCPSGQDEADCRNRHQCHTDKLRCRSGECVSSDFRCDGMVDCTDGSDEKGCEEMEEITNKTRADPPTPYATVAPPPTTTGQTSSRIKYCSGDGWLCADQRTCIPGRWVCDGEEDCDDESDEANCNVDKEDGVSIIKEAMMEVVTTTELAPSVDLCVKGQFRCRGGACMNASVACDGKADCPFGDDEGERCHECASRHNCSHICINTPSGHKCACPGWMSLSRDGETCRQFIKCFREGWRCAHFCENVGEGYECSCAHGYELSSDQHSCYNPETKEESLKRDSLKKHEWLMAIRRHP